MRRSSHERPTFDLQAHSTCSDGSLTPAEVVQRAGEAGVQLLALTDHDTVAGVDEALSAGRRQGITVVPAVEISAIHGRREDLHILGYGIDHHSRELLASLAAFRADRAARADRMAEALIEVGLKLDGGVLRGLHQTGGSIGRPHLARAVFEDERNAARLAREGIERPEQVLQHYLLPGRPAYRGRSIPTVAEAVALIHEARGVAVWAHPFWDIEDAHEVQATLEEFVASGLDGVETLYVTHDPMQAELLDQARRAFDLLSTGSSDFHGPDHAIFGAFRAHSLHGLEPHLGPIAASSAVRPYEAARHKERSK